MKKNILFLMTDQHRLDHVSYHGAGKLPTPNIDRIAGSVGFTNCQSVNPVCMPARCALITGKYSHQIGALNMSGDLSFQHPTMMQALQQAGYHTIGIGKMHFMQTWPWNTPRGKGLDLVALRDQVRAYGFDDLWETAGKQLSLKNFCEHARHMDDKGQLEAYREFVEGSGPNFWTPDGRPDEDGAPWPFAEEDHVDMLTLEKILERIRERPRDKPFYLFGSFCSPHRPMDPPQRFLDLVPYEEVDDFIPGEKPLSDGDKKILYRKRRAYKAQILMLDEMIGRIFEALEAEGVLEDTVILFTSDHGEMMGDHFAIQKELPWRESLTVPAAIRHPDFLAGRVNSSPVELIDFTATILDVAGLRVEESLGKSWPFFHNVIPCRSLMPIVRDEAEAVRSFTFSETNGIRKWQVIQTEDWKYIRFLTSLDPDAPSEHFYNLKDDPRETCNLIGETEWADSIAWCRRRRDFILDTTPPAQTVWAPLIGQTADGLNDRRFTV